VDRDSEFVPLERGQTSNEIKKEVFFISGWCFIAREFVEFLNAGQL
jgi:hypothetical protein